MDKPSSPSEVTSAKAHEGWLSHRGLRALLFLATYVVALLAYQTWASLGPFQIPWLLVFILWLALPEALFSSFLPGNVAIVLGGFLFLAVAVAGTMTTSRTAFHVLYIVFLILLALGVISLIVAAFMAARVM